MKKLALIAALGALALGSPATAGAAGKQRVVVDRFSSSYEDSADCAEVGPYQFEVLFAGRQRIEVTDVIGADGTLLQTVLNIGISETDVNSVTGESVLLKGAIHEVWDYAANTRTIYGKVWLGIAPGEGKAFQDTGLIRMTLDTHEPLSVAGPHEVFFGGGLDEMVCARLAG
jgi:hypothetical protein